MKHLNKLRVALCAAAVVFAVLFMSCQKDKMENNESIITENEKSYVKGAGTREDDKVKVVLMGVKQYYTLILPDGSIVVQMYCTPPYINEICAVFSVPKEDIKNNNPDGVNGTVVLYGHSSASDKIPANVELPVRQCKIDVDNNCAKFILN